MIEKIAEYIQEPNEASPIAFLHESRGLEKVASYGGEVQKFLDSLERKEGEIYALVNALTAGEFYGPNKNGDYFPEKSLKERHHTFVEHGHVYKHHVNKDPKKAMGKVIFSHYNDEMKRVEVVVSLKGEHPDVIKIIQDILDGKLIKTSMGCRVPYDLCSITKKKAKTRAEYSDYLKYQMNQTLPDGRRVYAENITPTFFDLSIVTIPADPVSGIMIPFGIEKIAELYSEKLSTIKKQVGAEMDFLSEDPKDLIFKTTHRLPQEKIEKLAEYPLNETLSTFLALRILPSREDFQKLAFYSLGKKELADNLEITKNVFTVDISQSVDLPKDIGIDFVNEKIASYFFEDISNFSLTKPAIINRIIEKKAYLDRNAVIPYPNVSSVTPSTLKSFFKDDKPQPASSGVPNSLPAFMALGTLYAGYARLFGETASASEFTTFIGRYPWLAPLVAGGVGLGITKMQKDVLDPVNKEIFKIGSFIGRGGKPAGDIEKFLGTLLVAAPISYYQSAKAEEKARTGQPLSGGEDFIRQNPFITSLGATFGARSFAKTFSNSMARRKDRIGSYANNSERIFKGLEKRSYDINCTETISLIYKEIIS